MCECEYCFQVEKLYKRYKRYGEEVDSLHVHKVMRRLDDAEVNERYWAVVIDEVFCINPKIFKLENIFTTSFPYIREVGRKRMIKSMEDFDDMFYELSKVYPPSDYDVRSVVADGLKWMQ